jgi:hypothetical protein
VTASPRVGARAWIVVIALAVASAIGALSFAFGPRGEPSDTGPGDVNATYVAGERVLVFYDGTFYPGRVLAVHSGDHEHTYHVGYDGFSTSWNEWVTGRRLKKLKAE